MTHDFSREIFYKTSRSGGSGGQNVNKVETAVEAWWCINSSLHFDPEQKELLAIKLRNRVNKDGYLIVRATDTRSQLENKAIALKKLQELVAQSLIKPKKRKATKPSKAAVERRLEAKRRDSFKKQHRRKDW